VSAAQTPTPSPSPAPAPASTQAPATAPTQSTTAPASSSSSTTPPQVHNSQLTPTKDTKPAEVTMTCPTPDQVVVEYRDGVDRGDITDHAIQVLKEICSKACIFSVEISSGIRSADSQAKAMYDNAQAKGVDSQRALYGPGGNKVLDAYQQGVKNGDAPATIQANMTKVVEDNASSFHHVARDPNLSVFDVAPSSIANSNQGAKGRLVKEAQSDNRIERFFQPPNDPGYHFEVRNP
jgi:hypothetical protein